jgi:hypothetical protein
MWPCLHLFTRERMHEASAETINEARAKAHRAAKAMETRL